MDMKVWGKQAIFGKINNERNHKQKQLTRKLLNSLG